MTHLTRLSLANRLIVGMVTIAIVVFGVLSTLSLRQELLPSTQVPTAILTATYPGTSPELVADEVATPLEQAISGVSGVTKVRSQSLNGPATLAGAGGPRGGHAAGGGHQRRVRGDQGPVPVAQRAGHADGGVDVRAGQRRG